MLSSLTAAVAAADLPADMPPSTLADALARVPDPRHRRGVRYPLAELLAVLVGAVLASSRTLTMIAEWAADAARTRPAADSGLVPTLSTIHRIATLVDAAALEEALHAWVRGQMGAEATAIDGKEVRGAKNGNRKRVFLMAAITHETGCVIGQESIGAKTNEIPHFPILLDRLGDLAGATVTADALHTQHEHAQDLHEGTCRSSVCRGFHALPPRNSRTSGPSARASFDSGGLERVHEPTLPYEEDDDGRDGRDQ